ncbi:MAG: lysophospholipid acyltransferase family protein [Chthonomonadales bacterium]|nr:lysophospholipid acyltransferase family protein [Chthonomonadales bacterium]
MSVPSTPDGRRGASAGDQKVQTPFRARFLGFVMWALARFIGMTLRVRFEGQDRLEEMLASGQGLIMITWHGRTLIPANVFRHRGYWVMISLSRDGEMQNCIFRRFGFQTVRGSTSRGGIRATLELARRLKEGGALAFTPDGPRGPTHKIQMGTLLLAQKSGCRIVPVGISARPRWLVRSWDRYMVPAPFARAVWIVGEPVSVSPDADDEEKARICSDLELALNRLEQRAEEMLGFEYPAEFAT